MRGTAVKAFLFATMAFASGCGDTGTFVVLKITAGAVAPSGIASIDVEASFPDQMAKSTLTPKTGANIALPTDAVLDLKHGSGLLSVVVIARDGNAVELARGSGMVQVNRNSTQTLAIQLGAPLVVADMAGTDGPGDLGPGDLGPPDLAMPDLTPPADLAGTPGLPTNVVASLRGALWIRVTWTIPPAGGTPITGQTVTSNPGGIMMNVGPATTVADFTGLTAGVQYTFAVTASNSAGAGPAGMSNPATAADVPGGPTGVTAVAVAPYKANVSFNAPSPNGAAITQFTVTSAPGGIVATGVGSPISLTGLTGGTSYTFNVTATNAIGTGIAGISNSIIAADVPGVPPSVVATAVAPNKASVSFGLAASNNSAITQYTVTSFPGGLTQSGAGSPLVVTGLTSGTSYTFNVTATNALGTGGAGVSNSITAGDVPSVPSGVVATALVGSKASVTFNAPASNGSPITQYTVTSSPGGLTGVGVGSPIQISGLTNGTSYTFNVTATNAFGTGSAGVSNSIVAGDLPGAPGTPTAVAKIGNQAGVTFGAAAANGAAISNYTVTSSPGGLSASGPSSPITVSGLLTGQAYTFTVNATNTFGTGPSSGPSGSIIGGSAPGAPTNPVATAVAGFKASVTFTAPPANGYAITNYTVTSNPGSLVGTGAGSPVTVNGLSNGTSYTFTVTATNALGTGPASVASNSIVAGDIPAKPTSVTTCPANGQTGVFWDVTPGATSYNIYFSKTTRPVVIGDVATTKVAGVQIGTYVGVVNGDNNSFAVTAVNALGESVQSDVDITNQFDRAIAVAYTGVSDTLFVGVNTATEQAIEMWDGWKTLAVSGAVHTRILNPANLSPQWHGLSVDDKLATIYLSNYTLDKITVWDHMAASGNGATAPTRTLYLGANGASRGLVVSRRRNTLFAVVDDTSASTVSVQSFYPACRLNFPGPGTTPIAGSLIGANTNFTTGNAMSLAIDDSTDDLFVGNDSTGAVLVFANASSIRGIQNIAPTRTITIAGLAGNSGTVVDGPNLYIGGSSIYRLPTSANGLTVPLASINTGFTNWSFAVSGNVLQALNGGTTSVVGWLNAVTLTGSPAATRSVTAGGNAVLSVAYVP